MAMIRCEKCNELIPDKSTNCVHCGYPVKSVETLLGKMRKLVTFVAVQ